MKFKLDARMSEKKSYAVVVKSVDKKMSNEQMKKNLIKHVKPWMYGT